MIPSAKKLSHCSRDSKVILSICQLLVESTSQTILITVTTKMAAATSVKFKLIFYVPPPALSACKAAIFRAGAGRYPGPGNYTECCWTAMGTGQFRPGDAANPHLGSKGTLEETQEVKVETLCVGEDVARQAVNALKRYLCAHIFFSCFDELPDSGFT